MAGCVKIHIWQADFEEKYLEESNKSRIFAALESATLPIEQRTRAELFVYMRMEYML